MAEFVLMTCPELKNSSRADVEDVARYTSQEERRVEPTIVRGTADCDFGTGPFVVRESRLVIAGQTCLLSSSLLCAVFAGLLPRIFSGSLSFFHARGGSAPRRAGLRSIPPIFARAGSKEQDAEGGSSGKARPG